MGAVEWLTELLAGGFLGICSSVLVTKIRAKWLWLDSRDDWILFAVAWTMSTMSVAVVYYVLIWLGAKPMPPTPQEWVTVLFGPALTAITASQAWFQSRKGA